MRAVELSRSEPNAFAQQLFDGLPRRYDVLEDVLSFGQNRRWRTAMVDAVTAMRPAPRRVLDVATGTAGVALVLADRTDAAGRRDRPHRADAAAGRHRVAAPRRRDRIRLVADAPSSCPSTTRRSTR